MVRFCELAEKEIPNFCGLEFADNDLNSAVACLKRGRNVFMGSDKNLASSLARGFDSAIITSASLFPKLSIEIYEHARAGKFDKANQLQEELNEKINTICAGPNGDDWVHATKDEFNRLNRSFSVGPCRKPSWNVQ